MRKRHSYPAHPARRHLLAAGMAGALVPFWAAVPTEPRPTVARAVFAEQPYPGPPSATPRPPTATPPATARPPARAGTLAPDSLRLLLPFTYRSGGVGSAGATATPPAPTPPPPPAGFEARCDASGDLEFCSWLPSGEPTGGQRVDASVRVLERDRPVAGAHLNVRWVFPYPTLFKYCEADTGPDGVASCGVEAPRGAGLTGAAQISLPYGGWPYQRQISFRIR
jgi:hypothetical protein